jgi:predicted Rdx family selenoprotein
MAQTSIQDLPVEFRKNGYPQLVKECKDVLKAAYMAQNKLETFYEDIGLR